MRTFCRKPIRVPVLEWFLPRTATLWCPPSQLWTSQGLTVLTDWGTISSVIAIDSARRVKQTKPQHALYLPEREAWTTIPLQLVWYFSRKHFSSNEADWLHSTNCVWPPATTPVCWYHLGHRNVPDPGSTQKCRLFWSLMELYLNE